ncbi:DUF1398 family protein [Roseomonas aeriglobus]|nr:DUF1398 family protein [Roseomonas aeriglobus]
MDVEALAAAERCTAGSDAGTMAFPEVIAAMIASGLERYHADLVRAEKIWFLPDGRSQTLTCDPLIVPPAMPFDAAGVAAAVRDAQAGAINYHGFCAAIATAGCVGYLVSIPGRRVVYYGRTAETHVELFPD